MSQPPSPPETVDNLPTQDHPCDDDISSSPDLKALNLSDPEDPPVCDTHSLTVSPTEVANTEDADQGDEVRLSTEVKESHAQSDPSEKPGSNACFPPLDTPSPDKSPTLSSAGLKSSEIYRMICSSPFLENLDIYHFKEDAGPIEGCRDLVQDMDWPKLTGTLRLQQFHLKRTVDLLFGLPGGLNFREIRLLDLHPGEVGQLMALVKRCSGTLERINIGCRLIGAMPQGIADVIPQPPTLDLSKATNLKEVTLRFITPNIPWITAVLKTLKPENKALQKISISCPIFSAKSVPLREKEKWAALDRTLDEFCESRSCGVKIIFSRVKDMEEWECKEFKRVFLPEMAGRKLVDLIPVTVGKERTDCSGFGQYNCVL